MNPRSGRASEFEQHRRKLWRIAYRMLGSQDEAEDMVQEAHLSQPATGFRHWMALPGCYRMMMTSDLEGSCQPVLLSDHLKAPEQATMSTRFSEDVVPLTDLKINPGRVIKHASEARRPVLLTSRGRGVAVVQSLSEYESAEEERAFMRAVVTGLADLEAGRELSLAEAKARLGLR
jgi:prevent-host-death family protein